MQQQAIAPDDGFPESGAGSLTAAPSFANALLDMLPVAIHVCDADGVILRYNRRAAELWGREPELGDTEQRFCGAHRLLLPDGRPVPDGESSMAQALRTGASVRDREIVVERPDGSRILVSISIEALRDPRGRITGAVSVFQDITERKAAEAKLLEGEARMRLLALEVDHRAKNMLASVQAIARMTRAESIPEFVEALMGRLRALARAHTLLSESRWTGVDLARLMHEELAAYPAGDAERVRMSGPAVALGSGAAQALAMAFHELATNAARHGALSVPGGRVEVEWSWEADDRLALRWSESGGPAPRPDRRRGFGATLIQATFEGQLGGAAAFDWRPEGLVVELRAPRRLISGGG